MKVDQLIGKVVLGFPKITLLLFVMLAVGAGMLLPGLERNPSPYLLPVTHESRVNLAKLRENFTGANDSILVLLEAEQTVFNARTLARVKALTNAFEQIHIIGRAEKDALLSLSGQLPEELAQKVRELAAGEVTPQTWMIIDEISEAAEFSGDLDAEARNRLSGVLEIWMKKLSPVREVTSLSNTDNILGSAGTLDVSPLFDQVPLTPAALSQLEQKVKSNELFNNILVAQDGKSTSIILELAGNDDQTDDQYLVYQQVKQIVENRFPGPETHYIAGLPVVTGALGKVMQTDTKKLFPIVILIVITCLFITFRKLKGILVPLGVVVLSLVVTLGIQVLFGIPLNIITTTLPVFILSIGVADGIHMFSEYRDHLLKGHEKKKAIELTLSHLAMPVIMTSVTTAVAFFAISLTKIVQLNHFGIFVSVGALVAMLFSLFFIPALLVLLPEKKPEPKKGASKIENFYADMLVKLTGIFLRYPARTVLFAAAVFVLSLFGASKVVVDNNNAGYFLDDSDIYISSQKLNRDAGGSAVINFLVTADSGVEAPFKKAENLSHVDGLVRFLDAQPHVGKVLGLSELIRRINLVLNDENPAFNHVPQPSADPSKQHLVAQMLLLYENAGGDTLSDFTDTGYTRLNIPVVIRTNSSRDALVLSENVKAYAAANFPAHIKLAVTGATQVSVAATDEIVKGQLTSLLVSLAVVLGMLFFTFRKVSYAGIAIVPLIMTISINFGIMGFFDIPLDIGTAIISSIVIGIGVDYAIHYLSRLKNNLETGMAFSNALENTVRYSGKAIVSNAATVGFGFVALWFSVLTPLITMGWMITVTMIVSAFCTLVLIPVLLVLVEKRTFEETDPKLLSQLTLQPQKIKY